MTSIGNLTVSTVPVETLALEQAGTDAERNGLTPQSLNALPADES
ncbi:hypothetical protein [Ramlibacter sp. WS9]|nr:hypothetical protein [Ramlibacter sp. WS9]